ncbi:MAG: LysM peptidoglycan-binding domain-containing protein [Luteolibacter sp.]
MKHAGTSIFASLLLITAIAAANETYIIKPGDNLTKIARKHNCTVADLLKVNDMKPGTTLFPGQELNLPSPIEESIQDPEPAVEATTPEEESPDPALKSIQATEGSPEASSEEPEASNDPIPVAIPVNPADLTENYSIRPGDNFTSIARRYGLKVDELMAANPNANPRRLRPGQVIQIPAKVTTNPPEPKNSNSATSKPEPDATPAAETETATETQATPATSPSTIETPPAQRPAPVIMATVPDNMTYGEFANLHGTDITRLNELNGYDFISSTVLEKGAEIYVPNSASQEAPEEP